MFLKLKKQDGENVLLNVNQISAVSANGTGTMVEMKNGDSYSIKEGFQAVNNRLGTLGLEVA